MSFLVDKQQIVKSDGTVDIQAFSEWYDELNRALSPESGDAPFWVDEEGRLHIRGWDHYAFREDKVNRVLVVEYRSGGNTWTVEFRLGEGARG